MINRVLQRVIEEGLRKQKVTLLLGARRTGKTALLNVIRSQLGEKALYLSGESDEAHNLLGHRSIADYQRLLHGYRYLFVDEAQYIPDYGRKLKLMIDHIEPLHILITGSSAFGLQEKGEPLVGRTLTYQLHPIAQMELAATENMLQTVQSLPDRLIYGSYPEVFSIKDYTEKQQYLYELINTYLLKDIFAFEHIRQPQKLKDLLKLLAWQIGGEVSLHELSRNLGISKPTIERYLDLLSKVYIIYNRYGYSNNLRKEIVKSSRWYFYDNGVRNALISSFAPMALRNDAGMLWENYVLSERLKKNEYTRTYVNSYFWRTYDGQEIDLIEEADGVISAFECKWGDAKTKHPIAFRNAYPNAPFSVIRPDNYLDWIT